MTDFRAAMERRNQGSERTQGNADSTPNAENEVPVAVEGEEVASPATGSSSTPRTPSREAEEDGREKDLWLGFNRGQWCLGAAWLLGLILTWIVFGHGSRTGLGMCSAMTLAYVAISLYVWSKGMPSGALYGLLSFYISVLIVGGILNVNPLSIRDAVESHIVESIYGATPSEWVIANCDFNEFFTLQGKKFTVHQRAFGRGALMKRTGEEREYNGMSLVEVRVTKDADNGRTSLVIWVEKEFLDFGDIRPKPEHFTVQMVKKEMMKVFFYRRAVLRPEDYLPKGTKFLVLKCSKNVRFLDDEGYAISYKIPVGRLNKNGVPHCFQIGEGAYHCIAEPNDTPEYIVFTILSWPQDNT